MQEKNNNFHIVTIYRSFLSIYSTRCIVKNKQFFNSIREKNKLVPDSFICIVYVIVNPLKSIYLTR